MLIGDYKLFVSIIIYYPPRVVDALRLFPFSFGVCLVKVCYSVGHILLQSTLFLWLSNYTLFWLLSIAYACENLDMYFGS